MDTSFFDVFRKRIKICKLEIFMCSDPLVDDCRRYIWIRLRFTLIAIGSRSSDQTRTIFSVTIERKRSKNDNHMPIIYGETRTTFFCRSMKISKLCELLKKSCFNIYIEKILLIFLSLKLDMTCQHG
ncbi:hypothetical protein BpHYR1_035491 [Brachionus plicatilis]|uniref:Uncharacterized protein n=1 Tax=Brachionus plicatilis TaxID=10195 RepID=A0A3M7QDT8_BRAPC|nr:hypothetical protein BpHYR1_035491 [Brachionus plicatilis]